MTEESILGEGDGMNKDAKVENQVSLEYSRQMSLMRVTVPVGNRTYFKNKTYLVILPMPTAPETVLTLVAVQ